MDVVRRRVLVTGRVQGVGYRWSCKQTADRLGVSGWVRNRPDGAVEIEAEGSRTGVDALVDWCRLGPTHAAVRDVEVADVVPTGVSGFTITS